MRTHIGTVARTITLLVAVAAGAIGCRQDSLSGGSSSAVRISPVFHAGNTFRFDRWALDEFGYIVGVTPTPETWTVVRTGAVEEGESGVAVLTTRIGSGPERDLLVSVKPTGEIAIFGALAAIVQDMGAGSIARRWDVLVPPGGLDPAVPWVVGVADSSAMDTAYGSFTGVSGYLSAEVNGVSTAYKAYSISVSSQRIQYTFLLADAPPWFPGFSEESTYAGNGFEADLTVMTSGSQ